MPRKKKGSIDPHTAITLQEMQQLAKGSLAKKPRVKKEAQPTLRMMIGELRDDFAQIKGQLKYIEGIIQETAVHAEFTAAMSKLVVTNSPQPKRRFWFF